ncbi:uncharacterized protein LOC119682349 [Teleopsis dalmanni]|uniref:uncharacterized protein LOC119682349 n=1 Tax=Teleopsis dalmanni TaxID=139649 RepID=UPI0018CF13F0|nr:uncharacterized protein LOC119682349 [Teleopsis dalmanni]
MKVYKIFLIFFFIHLTAASSNFSQLALRKHGPLYEAIKLLISDEQYNAQLVWNETITQYDDFLLQLQEAEAKIQFYNSVVIKRLEELNANSRPAGMNACIKEYEREIAHFNREILEKYNWCMLSLNTAEALVKNLTKEELKYIENAPMELKNVTKVCNVALLKSGRGDQKGITLCVVSKIGQIDQKLVESTQWCMNIISDISFADSEMSSAESCRDFDDLQQEFNLVYEKVQNCMRTF